MDEKIKISEGGGGEAMNRLIKDFVFKNLKNRKVMNGIGIDEMDDGAVIPLEGMNIVFTTDSYVVHPIFFRGGDIGKLAVNGTINDLAVMGAEPLALSLALVISEGFEKGDLERIMKSIGEVSEKLKVPIVTGDTKVIGERGMGIVINTSGIGIAKKVIRDSGAQPGDVVLLSGGIAEHGIAIMSQREGIEFEIPVVSDCREVFTIIKDLLDGSVDIHAAKDPTRGGIASALNEMASKSGFEFIIREKDIPVEPSVRSACEMLGLDPLEIANEGKVLIAVSPEDSGKALEILKKHDKRACTIGIVTEKRSGEVVLETVIGSRRVVRMPLGDPVPRVC